MEESKMILLVIFSRTQNQGIGGFHLVTMIKLGTGHHPYLAVYQAQRQRLHGEVQFSPLTMKLALPWKWSVCRTRHD
ncbi:Uncharacterized protein TCM_016277 [Theobroma cacao]|uniref:Uncharacterized protein n=1 Tax=Theobroma cacao TaxID=3641 RepID=A0A061G5V8_THECC|nr:Uncharacterized protein TCM_016277 [Theobroma cacao]